MSKAEGFTNVCMAQKSRTCGNMATAIMSKPERFTNVCMAGRSGGSLRFLLFPILINIFELFVHLFSGSF